MGRSPGAANGGKRRSSHGEQGRSGLALREVEAELGKAAFVSAERVAAGEQGVDQDDLLAFLDVDAATVFVRHEFEVGQSAGLEAPLFEAMLVKQ